MADGAAVRRIAAIVRDARVGGACPVVVTSALVGASLGASEIQIWDALHVASLMGAEVIGLGRELGSIEPGKRADLVMLNDNPLENIRNTNTIRVVMKNGKLCDGDTLAELYPREGPAPEFYWQPDSPKPAAGIEFGVFTHCASPAQRAYKAAGQPNGYPGRAPTPRLRRESTAN